MNINISDFLNKYFKKHRLLFFVFNIILVVILLNIFTFFAYPETNFTKALTLSNIDFMLFGLENEIGGLSLTFILAFIAIIGSFLLGSIIGIGRYSSVKIISIPCVFYVELFRALPIIMIIFWIFFAIPVVGMMVFGIKINISAINSAIIALTLFESAYIAEIVRAGLKSMPIGQFEAGKTIGMNSFQIYTLIILPQVYRRMIPAIISQFVSLFKDTSLVYVIGVIEFFRAATIVNNRIYLSFEVLSFVAIVYFICAFSLSRIANHLENKTKNQINT
jgi:polar amino acid transport system permease protein